MSKLQLGDISVNFVRALRDTIRLYQIDATPLFEAYGITEELLSAPKARISIPKFMRLGHAAIEATGEPALGLVMGGATHVGHTGLPGYAAMTASNLGLALATLIHFERLGSQNQRGYSQFYQEQGLGIARFYSLSPYNEYNFFVVDLMLSCWFHLGRWMTGADRLVREVQIEYPRPSYYQRHEELFQCPVLFDQPRNALILSKDALGHPCRFSAPATHAEAIAACRSELLELTRRQNIRERVERILTSQLQGKTPAMPDVASQLGMSPWTLRRKLEKEGVRFQDLLETSRRSLAESYVRDTNLSFSEIAFRLGFSSPAAFHRAFRRWTQFSPGGYRDDAQRDQEHQDQ